MRKFAVIGHPIGHTMSPPIHQRLFDLSGYSDTQYSVLDIAPENLEGAMEELQKLDGFNVTIPHKISIIPFLDGLAPSAAEFGSVNTVSCGDKLIGYNTDVDGFLRSIDDLGASLSSKVLLLGCGGVGRTFAIEAAKHNADLTIAVREEDIPTAREVADSILQTLQKKASVILLEDIKESYDLLINATPVGMYPHTDASPVTEETAANSRYVFDAVYNPIETELMKTARKHGAKAAGGLCMLVWQAVAAHEYWDNAKYDSADIRRLITEMEVQVKERFTK